VPSLYQNYRGRGEQRHVGGGGLILRGRNTLSPCPPMLSLAPPYNPDSKLGQKEAGIVVGPTGCTPVLLQLNYRAESGGSGGVRCKSASRQKKYRNHSSASRNRQNLT